MSPWAGPCATLIRRGKSSTCGTPLRSAAPWPSWHAAGPCTEPQEGSMNRGYNRREFFLSSLGAALALGWKQLRAAVRFGQQVGSGGPARPVIVCAANGLRWLDRGMEVLRRGGDTLDAVLAVV